MTDTMTVSENEVVPAPVEEAAAVAGAPEKREDTRGRGRGGDRGASRGRSPRRPGREKERSEFDQTTIQVRRVARVMAGGRRFSFSVVVVIGDRKGRVGVGIGKGQDTALAIDKAVRDARRNLITVPLTEDKSIRHEVSAKYASSTLTIIPSPGRGLVAGSAVRTVLEYAGVGNVVSKIFTRTKNKLTIARATVEALKTLQK